MRARMVRGVVAGYPVTDVKVRLLEGKYLAPHFVGHATGLHPLPVLVALLIGFHLAGLIGALVAVPLLAAIWEIARRLYVTPRRVST